MSDCGFWNDSIMSERIAQFDSADRTKLIWN